MAVQEVSEERMGITTAQPLSRLASAAKPRTSMRSGRISLALALMTGVLLWMCYFPIAWGWLAWFALVPLLALIRSNARARVVYLAAFAGGLIFYVPVIQWMRVADPLMYLAWAFVSTYCAIYFPLAIFLVRYLERRTPLPLLLTLPIVWTALDFFRSHAFTGFSWYLIGYSQHDWLPIIQIADLAGVYGVSFLVVAVNAILFEVCWNFYRLHNLIAAEPPRWSRLAVALQALAVLIVLASTIIYGVVRMQQAMFIPGPRIALVQGNLPQSIRNQPKAAEQVYRHYACLTFPATMYRPPDLVVWPETSYPYEYDDVEPDVDRSRIPPLWIEALERSHRELTEDVSQWWPTNVVIGLNSRILSADGTDRRYNSALLIDPQGDVAGRYDKIHRVPLGEYIPLRETLPFMKRLSPYDFEYGVAEGREHVQFPLTTKSSSERFSFGVVICYEDTVPELARPYGGGGTRPTNFLLNISNDGWFDGTSEHEEHLAICRFRAVECRRAVARAVNMGVSAVIDGNGRVLRPQEISSAEQDRRILPGSHIWSIPADPAAQTALPPSEWQEYKKVAGLLFATIPIDARSSFYARHGDWLPWSCWGLLGAGLVFARFRHGAV